MGYSAKILFRTDYVKTNGTIAIYIQVIVDLKKKVYPLQLFWPVEKIDKDKGTLLYRTKKDKDCDDYNVMLIDALNKANDIFKYYKFSGQQLTIERFSRDWLGNTTKLSFIKYIEDTAKQRLKKKEITYSTYQVHLKTLTKLKAWKKDIQFNDLDERWAFNFDAFLKNHINSRIGNTNNTRWAHHKVIKTYLHLAHNIDAIKYEDPYKFFSISLVESTWKPIHERDFIKLWNYYNDGPVDTHRLVLRRFLFACTTGLRVGDLYKVHKDWRHDGMITFMPQKTRRTNKQLELPLSALANTLFDQAIAEKKEGLLFDDFEEQASNRILKRIAKILDIRQNLHHHVGRSTFITLYLKNGGKIDVAKELVGHADIKTTMLYNHISEERKRSEIGYIDNIMNYFSDALRQAESPASR